MTFSIFNSQFSIVNDRLIGHGVIYLDCVKNTRAIVGPDMIILHYTAGSNCMSSAHYLTRPDVAASAHLVIGRAGEWFSWCRLISRLGMPGEVGMPDERS